MPDILSIVYVRTSLFFAAAMLKKAFMRRQKRRIGRSATGSLGLDRQKAFALQLLAGELAGAADGFGLLAGALLGRLLVMATQLHFAEDAFTLHLLLQRLKSLIDVVVANENLHETILLSVGRQRELLDRLSEMGIGRRALTERLTRETGK
jgi:hypothetical protein